MKRVLLKGKGVCKGNALEIMSKARMYRRMYSPYVIGTVRWCIWTTSQKNSKASVESVYEALLAAGVPVNAEPPVFYFDSERPQYARKMERPRYYNRAIVRATYRG